MLSDLVNKLKIAMRKCYILSLLILSVLFLGLGCSSTDRLNSSDSNYEEVPMPEQALSFEYPEPDVWAKYPGGSEAVLEYIKMNSVIPEQARREGYEGRLLLTYVVDVDGNAGQVEIIRTPHDTISDMYKDIVENMEKWEPAILDGEPIEQRYVFTSFFRSGSSQE
jgi:hypothetical protein